MKATTRLVGLLASLLLCVTLLSVTMTAPVTADDSPSPTKPVATPDDLSARYMFPLGKYAMPELVRNDVDPQGLPLKVVSCDPIGKYGKIVINSDGVAVLMLGDYYGGFFTFDFNCVVGNGSEVSDPALVTIKVSQVIDLVYKQAKKPRMLRFTNPNKQFVKLYLGDELGPNRYAGGVWRLEPQSTRILRAPERYTFFFSSLGSQRIGMKSGSIRARWH